MYLNHVSYIKLYQKLVFFLIYLPITNAWNDDHKNRDLNYNRQMNLNFHLISFDSNYKILFFFWRDVFLEHIFNYIVVV